MKLSARARYAVRFMIEVDRLGQNRNPVRLSEISRRTGISRRFLEQLAIGLKSRSLLGAVPGRNGGYLLTRAPKQISIREVITAVIGPITLATCVEDPDICMYAEICECRLLWSLLQKQIDKLLEKYTLADLSDQKSMASIREQVEAIDTAFRIREDRCSNGNASVGVPACARATHGDCAALPARESPVKEV